MAVVEYKLEIVGSRGQMKQPNWIRDAGHFHNPDDYTKIGWIVDNAEYYIPDTVVSLTKEELVTRQLGIHSNYPEQIYTGDETDEELQRDDTENWRNKTNAEVRAEVEAWYDDFTTLCQDIER